MRHTKNTARHINIYLRARTHTGPQEAPSTFIGELGHHIGDNKTQRQKSQNRHRIQQDTTTEESEQT